MRCRFWILSLSKIFELDISVIESKKIDSQICKIFGVDKAEGFLLKVPHAELQTKAQDIWDHPENYRVTEDSYYDFLKFLWISYPNGSEARLADLIVC